MEIKTGRDITSHLLDKLCYKYQKITGVIENVEKREPFVHCGWECKLVQLVWSSVEVPKKFKKELPFDTAIPFLGICTEMKIMLSVSK